MFNIHDLGTVEFEGISFYGFAYKQISTKHLVDRLRREFPVPMHKSIRKSKARTAFFQLNPFLIAMVTKVMSVTGPEGSEVTFRFNILNLTSVSEKGIVRALSTVPSKKLISSVKHNYEAYINGEIGQLLVKLEENHDIAPFVDKVVFTVKSRSGTACPEVPQKVGSWLVKWMPKRYSDIYSKRKTKPLVDKGVLMFISERKLPHLPKGNGSGSAAAAEIEKLNEILEVVRIKV